MRTSFLSTVILFSSFLAAGPTGLARPKAEAVEVTAPLEIYEGYLLVVQGSVGPIHGLRFLLDTGQTLSSIDVRVAKQLDLATHPGTVYNIDRPLPVEWGELPEMTYAGQRFTGARVLLSDLAYLRANGVPVDGVVGLDLLRRQSFRLDLNRRHIVFGQSAILTGRQVSFIPDAASLQIQLDVDGRTLPVIADSGMQGIVLYREVLDSMAADYKTGRPVTGVSLGGAIPYTPALVPRLRLGTQDLERNVRLVNPAGNPSARRIAGYFGLASLHAKWIEFDFEHQQLRWSN